MTLRKLFRASKKDKKTLPIQNKRVMPNDYIESPGHPCCKHDSTSSYPTSNTTLTKTKFESEDSSTGDNELNSCEYYCGNISERRAVNLLSMTEEGTYLLRVSSHPEYSYSLSVKTDHGVTSVRIKRSQGTYHLETQITKENGAASKTSVVELVRYYVNLFRHNTSSYVFLESCGNFTSIVRLKQPYNYRY